MKIFHNIFLYILSIFFYSNVSAQTQHETKPHIIVIITDDMGWNDVSYHGSNEIPTPNIDALAYNGVILNRHYALPTCTPSRAAFLTGRHPIRMGLQGIPMNVGEPRGVPLSEKLLPEYLKKLGYSTRLVGKWHLGYYTDEHTPTRRGFDSFVGYYGGVVTYFNHTATKNKHTGIDFHSDKPDNIKPYNNDQYLTDFITDEAENIIKNHDRRNPLYLQIAHVAAHSTENVEPLEVRNMTKVNETLGYIPNINRRRYAGIVTAMDESVGKVIKALSDANMLDNSVVIFMSDNGAPSDDGSPIAATPYLNYGSNYPLRGVKATVLEGGVRVPSVIFSPLLKNRSRVSNEYMHITDWFPTLYKLAGGDLSKIQNIDGIDQWSTISEAEKTKRSSMLINIDEVIKTEAAIVGKHKLVRGTYRLNGYFRKDGSEYSPKTYNTENVLYSLAGRAIKELKNYSSANKKQMTKLRSEATIHCERLPNYPKCVNTCLFNIIEDPCETTDISNSYPEIVNRASEFLNMYRKDLVNQTNTYIDPKSYPEHFNGYWMPWLDHEYTPPKHRNVSAIWTSDVFCEGYPIDDPRNCVY